MPDAIVVNGLEKSYGTTRAVAGVDLRVGIGEIVAVLGPNGAGKTTTVEILEGFRKRDSGTVSVLGTDPESGGRALRTRIGIVLQSTGIEPFLTVREVVELYGGYYPRHLDIDQVIDLVGLTDKSSSRVKSLSGGQQRRVDLALGLVGDPELVFLDEPTTGFDPGARRGAWAIVSGLRDLGKTVLLTTHYMDEAQHLADRVVIMAGGRVVAEGAPDQLGNQATALSVVRFVLPPGAALSDVPIEATLDGDTVVVETHQVTADIAALATWALDLDTELDRLTITRPSLEDVYLQLTVAEEAR